MSTGAVGAVEIVVLRRRTEDEWMEKGACRGMTHLFFPSSSERPQARERREAMAREVCRQCNVAGICRDFARENHEYGFWGGESEDERHQAGFRLIAPIGLRSTAV
ncbi:MAG: WhiB family transcriptional regulator [Ilumatobacteraceae bacterium]